LCFFFKGGLKEGNFAVVNFTKVDKIKRKRQFDAGSGAGKKVCPDGKNILE